MSTTKPLFVFGTLRDRALLALVAGETVEVIDARLPGCRVAEAAGQSFPILREDPDGSAVGVLMPDLTPQQAARLDYYEAPYEYHRREVRVVTSDGEVSAEVYVPPDGRWMPASDWSLAVWQAQHGALMREAAVEIMDGFGRIDPADIAGRFPVIRTRAQQRCNAREVSSPTILRRPHSRDDVKLIEKKQSYAHFFAVEDAILTARKFDGGFSEPMERAVFVTADAVTVLPYDPLRDRVLLIEQFRAATYLRGDRNPWSLEAIAGRQDPGETREDSVRREAMEEAGLTLGALHKVASYYSSPGANTEYMNSYIAIADLPDGTQGVGGLDSEAEDIRSMLVSFETLMEAVENGEAENGPLVISALWLAQRRAGFQAAAN
ncbi:gamma-glutamylcyclotransferase [Litoreibacter sp.]|nr:gamma-glutamylcyclotransferase [Litoreibacter sp.]